MTVKLSWKVVGKSALVLVAGLFIGLAVYVTASVLIESRKPVQIVPWSPAQDSSYTCYVALQGQYKVLAMDCLDRSLTLAPTPTP